MGSQTGSSIYESDIFAGKWNSNSISISTGLLTNTSPNDLLAPIEAHQWWVDMWSSQNIERGGKGGGLVGEVVTRAHHTPTITINPTIKTTSHLHLLQFIHEILYQLAIIHFFAITTNKHMLSNQQMRTWKKHAYKDAPSMQLYYAI